ncbi:hypothetical protein [Yunchengibacter salinarum]|uniref:hypothetical protein n=1 Tax=Yunchengibacter salinarum TaxID=3133399 RepID=UPI0035B6655C
MSDDFSPAVRLLSAQKVEREKIRLRWKKDAGDLINAHELALSAVYSMIDRLSGRRFEPQPKTVEGRMSLITQFLQGVDVCEVSISEGLYSQAAALLKQQLETIAAIDEYKNDRRKEGITPNIAQGITSKFGPIYGDLNGIAHVSRHDLARQLVTVEKKDIVGPSLIPQYNRDLAKFLYGNHLYFIIAVGRQASQFFYKIFNEGFSDKEKKWQFIAITILLRENVIKLPDDAQERFPHIDFDEAFTRA